MPLGIRDPHPVGMPDNSPTFQRWDHDDEEPSPAGTAEIDSAQPSLRDSTSRTSNPTLKRWAIIVCPSETDRACAAPNLAGKLGLNFCLKTAADKKVRAPLGLILAIL